MLRVLIFIFSVSQDTLHTRKLQQGPEPGAREPGEGAGESTLLHDDHGDSFIRAERREGCQERGDPKAEGIS